MELYFAAIEYEPFRIFSAECTSRLWYASTRSVIAFICGSFLYLFVHNNYQHWITQSLSRHGNVRLRFLAVKWIHFASREHVGKHEVFKDLDSLWRACFIVVPKRLKEIFTRAIPLACISWVDGKASLMQRDGGMSVLTFTHPHFPPAFLNNAHDARMRDGRANSVCGIVDLLHETTPITSQVRTRTIQSKTRLQTFNFLKFRVSLYIW
jgi:hypothetical protein